MLFEALSSPFLLVLIPIFLGLYLRRNNLPPTPPGPTSLPFVGSYFSLPRHGFAKTFASWKAKYGDLIYVNVVGRKMIILNSAEVAMELFDSRGAMYSDKPRAVMAGELLGKTKTILFLPYNERFKRHRNLLQRTIGPRRSREYWQMQYAESYRLMDDLMKTPEHFIGHIRRNANAVALRMVYGYTTKSMDDRFIAVAERLARLTGEATEPGRWLVDSFPSLKYVPDWFPGAGFKRWARNARKTTDELANAPYSFAKKAATAGVNSFVAESLELFKKETGEELNYDDDDFLKWTAASIYIGANDTVTAFGTALFLFMAVFPDIQRKAQAEIDAVLGKGQLATVEDMERLPYVDAVIKELHRYNPVAPLIPHTTLADDIYRGYHIPKGSFIVANSAAIMHDPKEFPEPERFWPERYLPEGAGCTVDPRAYSFGFGRRRCPGIAIATAQIFLTVAHTLAVFDISNPCDEAGNKMTFPLSFTEGHLSHPSPFRCTIEPRSQAVVDLISNLTSSS
ncbi:cytochrome P450 [Amylocystis lapponica]|nr:cytochrome P450 [Amylocystis lapponica]